MARAAEHEWHDQPVRGTDTKPGEPVALEPRPDGALVQAQDAKRSARGAGKAAVRVNTLADQALRRVAGTGGDDHLAVALVVEQTSRHYVLALGGLRGDIESFG